MDNNQRIRYSRHFQLPEIGVDGQHKLNESAVLVVGAGGLGSPVLQYLAAAGVGTIGIIDDDVVELSNLQRQVLFSNEDIGKEKALIAEKVIKSMNPGIRTHVFTEKLHNDNALSIIPEFDLIIDCTDNFPTRYLINDACVLCDKPFIYGSIHKFEGQVSIFNHPMDDGMRINYRDLFETPPPPELVPSCAEGGVVGTLPGIIGSVQANEAIKLLTGMSDILSGKLWIIDTKSMQTRTVKIRAAKSGYKIEKLINYEYFCKVPSKTGNMKEINVKELKKLQDKNKEVVLVDVREKWENEMANIGGMHIPQGEVMEAFEKIPKDKQVVVYCRSGRRSANVIQWLEENHDYDNLYNLEGGILAWSDEIDPSIPKY